MKTKLRFSALIMASFVAVNSMAGTPTLGIVLTNSQVVFYWPSNAPSYVLQSSTNLTSTNWAVAHDIIPAIYGSQTAVTVTNSSSLRFFRLISLQPTTPDGMVFIPAGVFTMGDTLDGDANAVPTNVYVSAFYMDTNLVSFSQWQSLYIWATNNGYSFVHAGTAKASNHPVMFIDWYDMVKWSNARSQLYGLTPVYYTDAALTQIYTNGEVAPFVNWNINGYRLPTEAEWEKAVRGGLNGQRFPWGLTISESQANYYSTNTYSYDLGPYSGWNINFIMGGYPYTSPVGYFAPNGYGLYDMVGNAYECCWDYYSSTGYGQPTTNNPTGPTSGVGRVTRGGCWYYVAYRERCAVRTFNLATATNDVTGFRCARGL